MSKLIKQIHDLIGLAIDKGYTQYISDSQIDDAIDQGQMVLFRELLKEHPRNKRIRNDLMPFEVRANVTLSSNVGDLPDDFEHEIEAWYDTGTGATAPQYPIQIVEAGFYRRRLLDVVDPPSTANIFASIHYDAGRKIEVSRNVSAITLNYFARPTKPEYATTAASGQYIYDDTTSTDVLWAASMHDMLVQKSLGILGLNMRDGQVQRSGVAAIPKESTV